MLTAEHARFETTIVLIKPIQIEIAQAISSGKFNTTVVINADNYQFVLKVLSSNGYSVHEKFKDNSSGRVSITISWE